MRKLFAAVAATALLSAPAAFAQSQTLLAFGDSITLGTGASPSSNGYASVVATAKGWTLDNHANSGTQASDYSSGQIDAVLQQTVSDTTKTIMLSGYNDMRAWGSSTTGLATYADTLRAMLIWLATRSSMIQTGQSLSSGWTNLTTSAYLNNIGIFSSTTNATATAHVYGDVIYVVSIRLGTGGGTFTLWVDGTQFGSTYSCNDAQATLRGAAYAPLVVRIDGQTETTHEVTMKVTSGSGNVFLMWMSGNRGASTKTGPEVWVGNCLRMPTTTAYGLGTYSAGSDAAVGLYNRKIREVVRELAGDGLNVTLADAGGAYILSTDVDSDTIHPNNTGHAHIADAFLKAMQTTVVAGDRGGRQ
ncbi:MAG: hypothetical protein QOI24_3745 [Acidobacteriota bacterium]|jgi:lysophospholipase L1-like esterase|nr:hypothetical protein [Acidobacteriota bacterium]